MKSKGIITIYIIITIVIISTVSLYAESNAYVLDSNERVPIPETYILKDIIYYFDGNFKGSRSLNSAEDLFIGEDGYLYVADTGNNRILRLTKDGRVMGIFIGPADKPLKAPKAVFADEKGNMLIADTGNGRILNLASNGRYIEEFGKPESDLIGDILTYEPSKLCITNTGYIYTIRSRQIMVIDSYNRFRGYLGQSNIGFSLMDTLLRRFASEEQKKVIKKRLSANYINLTLGHDGMIYAVSNDMRDGEIKKLNSIGENIYRRYGADDRKIKLFDLSSLFSLNLVNKPFFFGERVNNEGEAIKPYFEDIEVDKNGIITVIESILGKVYQYDAEGNLLTVFGGTGTQKGKFKKPVSIEIDEEGNIYVLDRSLNNIQIFEPTRFIKMIHSALKLYYEGEYESAHELWTEILKIDENYQLAKTGIAKALYKQEKWKEAMAAYLEAGNRAGYTQAFSEYRREMFRDNFTIVVICIAAIIMAIIFLLKIFKKTAVSALSKFKINDSKKIRTLNMLKFSLNILYNPRETFETIKENRERMNYLPSFIILLFVIITRIIYIYTVHFPLMDVEPRDSNIWLELTRFMLPAFTWVLGSFAASSISSGESKIGEIFVSTSFCFIPHILITIPLALLSGLLANNENGFYAFIINLTWIWIILLIFTSVKILNDYSIFKTAGICLISVAFMSLIVGVSILWILLLTQFYEFVRGLLIEMATALTT